MIKSNVVCTLPMDPAGVSLLADRANVIVAADTKPETLYGLLDDADFLVVRSPLPEDIFDHPNRLRGVIRHGAGLDMIPVESATAHGIPVANVPGANAQAVAEYCIAAFLALARGLQRADRALREQGWHNARALSDGAAQLMDKTVGIVGLGNVGSRLALACHHGFAMRVLGYQPGRGEFPDCVQRCDLEELLAAADYVVLACPLTPQTRGMLNAVRLGLMRPGAALVNAARGPIVDEAALVEALRAGRIRAALDVFAVQPLPEGHPYLSLPDVLLTPHLAGLTQESRAAMSVGTAEQILQLMAGKRPRHLANPEVWPPHWLADPGEKA